MSTNFFEAIPEPLRTIETGFFTEYWELRRNKLLEVIDLFIDFDGDYEKYSTEYLDSISSLFGFSTSNFWSTGWSKKTKSMLFKGVYNPPYIWQNQFTFAVFEYIFSCFSIDGGITSRNGFIVNVGVVNVDTLGDDTSYTVFFRETNLSDRILVDKIVNEFFPLGIERKIIKIP